jgi:hypothetical protein
MFVAPKVARMNPFNLSFNLSHGFAWIGNLFLTRFRVPIDRNDNGKNPRFACVQRACVNDFLVSEECHIKLRDSEQGEQLMSGTPHVGIAD